MNRFRREQIDKLIKGLAQAHERRDTPRFPPHWLGSVMHEIRRQPAGVTPWSEAPRMIWRAAAIVALVSALLMGSILTWNAERSEADSAALLADASLDPILPGGEP